MLDFRLLTREQIDGEKAFSVLKSYGLNATATDLAVLQGGVKSKDKRTRDGKPICTYWTESPLPGEMALCASIHDSPDSCYAYERWPVVRPVLPASEVKKIQLNKVRETVGGVDVYEFGEYPQTVADGKTSQELETLFQEQKLDTTGKKYTFDSTDLDQTRTEFTAKEHDEYEYNGQKYIRVTGRPYDSDSALSPEDKAKSGELCLLSTGEKAQAGQPYWVRVEPLEWLLNKETGDLVSLKGVVAGLQLDPNGRYTGGFLKTPLHRYLVDYFGKEITPSQIGPKTRTRRDQMFTIIEKWIKEAKKRNARRMAEQGIVPGRRM